MEHNLLSFSSVEQQEYSLNFYGKVTVSNKHIAERYYEALKPYRVECFKVAVNVLEEVNVSYFITCGTLLAAHRDGGIMIPYDYDTDVSINEKDYLKIVKLKDRLPEGYVMDTSIFGFEWMQNNGEDLKFDPIKPQAKYKLVKIRDVRDYSGALEQCRLRHSLPLSAGCFMTKIWSDILTYREEDETIFDNIAGQGVLGSVPYLKTKIFPTKTYLFEGIECQGPNDPKHVLDRCIGYQGKDFYFDEATYMYKKIGM